jgi:hypothetical protein
LPRTQTIRSQEQAGEAVSLQAADALGEVGK